jgi:hypothetical protein
MFDVSFYGYRSGSGADYAESARIRAVAGEDFSATGLGTRLGFFACAVGGTTPVERIRIASNGNVGIGGFDAAYPFQVDGDMAVKEAGQTLRIKESSNQNACMGVATLGTGGEVVVTTSAVAADSRILLTIQAPGATGGQGSPYVKERTAGTSFKIKSTDSSDTSIVAWLIVRPV